MTRHALRGIAAVALVVLAGCDSTRTCNAILVFDTFSVILDRAEWPPTDYRIELAYETDRGEQSVTCSFRVPFAELMETDDGGVDIIAPDAGAANDAGPQSAEGRLCASSASGGTDVRVSFGHGIVILGQGNPDKLQITVRDPNDVVLERELRPSYTSKEPNGPGCGKTYTGAVRVTLP